MKIPDKLKNIPYRKLFIGVLLLVALWLLIHIFALVGLLVAPLYWILWSLKHQMVPCISPMMSKTKDYCVWCNARVVPNLPHWPVQVKSTIKNISLIIVVSLASLMFVYIELLALGLVAINPLNKDREANNGEVAFIESTGNKQYYIGEIIPMPIELEQVKTSVNAVQADIGFDPKSFELLDFTLDGSFANIFIQKQIDNDKGYGRISGGLPNPGFMGDRGVFATALLKTKQSGLLGVYFLPTSAVLANDGKATNLLQENYSITFDVINESIPKEKLQEQEKMYLKRSGVSLYTQSQNESYLEFTDGVILGAATSKELEEAQKEALKKEQKALVHRYDAFVIRVWTGWFTP